MKKSFAFVVITFLCYSVLSNCFAQTNSNNKSALDYYNEGQQMQTREKYTDAIELYQEALSLNNSYSDVWFAMAQCAYELREYNLTIQYLEKTSKLSKNNVEIENLKGLALIGLGRLEEAKNTFQSVLEKYPNDLNSRFGLAELDIFDGKISGAEKYYNEALLRNPQNRKALLSMALVSYELGKTKIAKDYINKAIQAHSGESEVYYFAAYLSIKDGQLKKAENQIQSAIQLNPEYDEAYELLSVILFNQKRYEELLEICNKRIDIERNLYSAWYVKGKTYEKLNQYENAIQCYKTGLEINPQDEIMRSSLEQVAYEQLSVEDKRRTEWANYHVKKAHEYVTKYQGEKARYEYEISLRINPLDLSSRQAYSELLLQEGYPESYLSQIKFIQEQGLSLGIKNVKIDDTVESYNSLLKNTLPLMWQIDPFYLDKVRVNIGLFYSDDIQLSHIESNIVTAKQIEQSFLSESSINFILEDKSVKGYAEAFRQSRKNKQDYFALLSFNESERDLTITITLYVTRTGSKAGDFTVYRTGNDKYSNAIQKITQLISRSFPVQGKIIDRRGTTVLIDMGKRENLKEGDELQIVKKDCIYPNDSGLGVYCNEDDIIGTCSVTSVGEDLAQGEIKQKGFYDRINVNDELLLVKTNDEENTEEQKDEVPVIVIEGSEAARHPSLIKLLQEIN